MLGIINKKDFCELIDIMEKTRKGTKKKRIKHERINSKNNYNASFLLIRKYEFIGY